MNKINTLIILSMLLLAELSHCQEYPNKSSNIEEEIKNEAIDENGSDDREDDEDTFKETHKYIIKTDPLSPPPMPDDMLEEIHRRIFPLDPQPIPDHIRKKLEEQRAETLFNDYPSPLPETWIVESSLDQAPPLLKGIILYLQAQSGLIVRCSNPMFIPSCHRFILVGPPGSGKTTLAHAIASKLECPAILIPATSLLGHFRNETANNISERLEQYKYMPKNIVVIIDELHKLFEHHESDRTDDSQSAAAFWLAVDQMEKHYSRAILICTANDVSTLPSEIKSRFAGKVIEMQAPKRKHKIKVFKESIRHDVSTYLDRSIDNRFILKIIDQLPSCSLRDIRLLIDTAKMFYYEENPLYEQNHAILLTKKHFQKALNQLQAESFILAGNLPQKFIKNLEKWGLIISIVGNLSLLFRTLHEFYNLSNNPGILSANSNIIQIQGLHTL